MGSELSYQVEDIQNSGMPSRYGPADSYGSFPVNAAQAAARQASASVMVPVAEIDDKVQNMFEYAGTNDTITKDQVMTYVNGLIHAQPHQRLLAASPSMDSCASANVPLIIGLTTACAVATVLAVLLYKQRSAATAKEADDAAEVDYVSAA